MKTRKVPPNPRRKLRTRSSARFSVFTLEGNILVGDLRFRPACVFCAYDFVLSAIGSGPASGARACCRSFAASAEHAKIRSHNFKTGAFLSFFVLPLAGLNSPLDKNQRALLQVLLRDLRLLAPNHDLVPFRAFLPLAGAAFVCLVCRHREIRNSLTATGISR